MFASIPTVKCCGEAPLAPLPDSGGPDSPTLNAQRPGDNNRPTPDHQPLTTDH